MFTTTFTTHLGKWRVSDFKYNNFATYDKQEEMLPSWRGSVASSYSFIPRGVNLINVRFELQSGHHYAYVMEYNKSSKRFGKFRIEFDCARLVHLLVTGHMNT